MMNCHRLWYCIALLLASPLYAHPFLGPNRHLLQIEKLEEIGGNDQSAERDFSSSESEFDTESLIPFESAFDQRVDQPLNAGQLQSTEESDSFNEDFFKEENVLSRPEDADEGGREEVLSDISSILNTFWNNQENENEDARRKSKSLKDDSEEGNAGIAVRLTKRALLTAAQNITNFLVYDISQLSISDITLRSMDLNITLHGIKTHSYVPPGVHVTVEDDIITLKTTKGSVNLFGQYTAVYKTIRQGVIEARMSGFDVNLKLKLSKSAAGSLNLNVHSCAAFVETLHVDLIRHLLDEVTDDVRKSLHSLSTSSICKYLTTYVHKLNNHLNKVMTLKQVDVHTNVPQGQMHFDLTVSDDPEIFVDHIDIPMFGEFTRSTLRTPFKPHTLMKRISDSEKMIYIYISDFVVNSFFYQLEAIADWKGKLHRLPEIANALLLSCSHSDTCLGHYIENADDYIENSGRMYGRARGRPQVRLTDRGAHLKMNLSVDVTYQPKDNVLPRTVVRFDVRLQLHVDSFSVRTNETAEVEGEQRYKVNASGGIDQLEIDEMIVYDENWKIMETVLPVFVAQRKPKLEMMLRENMHTVLSFSDSGIPAINSIDGHFRKHTLVLGFDVDMESAISDFLQLPDFAN